LLQHTNLQNEEAPAVTGEGFNFRVHAPARALNKGNNSEDQQHTATAPLA